MKEVFLSVEGLKREWRVYFENPEAKVEGFKNRLDDALFCFAEQALPTFKSVVPIFVESAVKRAVKEHRAIFVPEEDARTSYTKLDIMFEENGFDCLDRHCGVDFGVFNPYNVSLALFHSKSPITGIY